jgi:TolB protein
MLMRPDGSGVRQIAECDNAAWAPDSKRLVCSRSVQPAGIFVVDLVGEVSQLTSVHDDHPVWSPDGTKIVFVRNETFPSRIMLMNRDGSGLKQLAGPGARPAGFPSWSPDGRWILLEVRREANREQVDLYKFRPDGMSSVRLTREPCVDGSSWSPTGREIAVVIERCGDWPGGIGTIRANGTGLRRLTKYVLGPPAVSQSAPVWSPKGTRLAYVRRIVNADDRGTNQIWVVNRDGTGKRRLTGSRLVQEVAWAPYSYSH